MGSWLAATARNECLRSLAARKKVVLADDDVVLEGAAAQSRRSTSACSPPSVRRWSARPCRACPGEWQRMLELLMADPPASYAEISDQLGLPIGSIGPTRSRCLARLRDLLHPSLTDTPRPAASDPALRPVSREPARRTPSTSASTQRPPAASTSGKAARTSGSRSARKRTTAAGR